MTDGVINCKLKFIYKGSSWVFFFFAVVMWVKNYDLFYFGSFIESDVMLEEHPKLSRKWRISGKPF